MNYKISKYLIPTDYPQQELDDELRHDVRRLVRIAIAEDLDRGFDLTTLALVDESTRSVATIVARKPGVAAGVELIADIVAEAEASIEVETKIADGDPFEAKQPLAILRGNTRDILTTERTILNLLGRLCGIAQWTHRHVGELAGLSTRVYDTRKTLPGWRRADKYAVRCGGGWNHRMGLYDAVLIKDNHLACYRDATGKSLSPAEATLLAREFIRSIPSRAGQRSPTHAMTIEIEVDSIEQLESALTVAPDIVLLDNMPPEQLRRAVEMRSRLAPNVILEASGGVRLDTIRAIAETGVDRVSVGGLTHSATNLDVGLDW